MFGSFAQSSRNDSTRIPKSPRRERPKRAQVARACAWCRGNRIKCDDQQPCRKCQKRKQICIRDKTTPPNLPIALQQIAELEAQVAVLQSQASTNNKSTVERREPSFETTSSPATTIGEHPPSGQLQFTLQPRFQYFGQSFLQRLSIHLSLLHGWHYTQEQLQPKPVTFPYFSCGGASETPQSLSHSDGVFMRKEQEEECLQIFWQSYHCAVPILDEGQVREHHAQLWRHHRTGTSRGDSPLIDIMLAICIQYGMTRVEQTPNEAAEDTSGVDPSNAGRWYFRRCQSLLKPEVETPSIMLLQCQILSTIYLRDASLFNTSLSVIATAVQTSYALGLHLEPSESVDRIHSEMNKRLWCMVFVLESKMNMDYGRPFCTHGFNVQPPGDDKELASISTEMFTPDSNLNITWLTYHLQHVKLIRAARGVVESVRERQQNLVGLNNEHGFCLDDDSWSDFDSFIAGKLVLLSLWLDDVPEELKCEPALSLNTQEASLPQTEVQLGGPIWLQRQRIMLRLLYHDVVISICRPLVLFSAPSEIVERSSSKCASECLAHAAAITDILHDVFARDREVLYGWHRAYQFQWNAAISMIAFALGEPGSSSTPWLVDEIEKAIANLEIFGRSFAVARSAERIIRELYGRLHARLVER